jgi:hypothetical protein
VPGLSRGKWQVIHWQALRQAPTPARATQATFDRLRRATGAPCAFGGFRSHVSNMQHLHPQHCVLAFEGRELWARHPTRP